VRNYAAGFGAIIPAPAPLSQPRGSWSIARRFQGLQGCCDGKIQRQRPTDETVESKAFIEHGCGVIFGINDQGIDGRVRTCRTASGIDDKSAS